MMIIGIAGKAGAGKSTAARVLVSEFGFVELAFADKLKKICQEVYGFSDDQLYGSLKETSDKRYPRNHTWEDGGAVCACCGADYEAAHFGGLPSQCYLTPRYAMKTLGTEWGRHCYPNTWVDLAMRRAAVFNEHVEHKKTGVVLPDLRFQSEFDALIAKGGYVWRILRPGGQMLSGNHPSERGFDAAPHDVIVNDTTLDNFRHNVRLAFERLRTPRWALR
jgi:hypothetical protein